MEDVQQPVATPRKWLAVLGGVTLGVLGAAATLWILEIALPGDLPSWAGYALAAVCLGFGYARNVRAGLAKRAERRTSTT